MRMVSTACCVKVFHAHSSADPKKIGEWTTEDVSAWLIKEGFPPHHVELAKKNEIGGKQLLQISRSDLVAIGFTLGRALQVENLVNAATGLHGISEDWEPSRSTRGIVVDQCSCIFS